MSIDLIVHDTRLEGRTPLTTGGTISFDVDGDTPLSDFFERAIAIADEHDGIGTLFVMAHGVLVLSENTTAIQFCHEFISFRTVHEFERLRDKVERIVLYVCHAAETSMTPHGDGDELCRYIALGAHAEVTAARQDQAYTSTESCTLFSCEESAIEFGAWEGPVVVYDADGQLISEFQNPSAWRGSDGVLHDPRVDPRS